MTAAKIPKGPISAADLGSLKEQMRRDDPEYRAQLEAAEHARRERVQALRQAAQPIVADLQHAGLDVGSVRDLVNTTKPYPARCPYSWSTWIVAATPNASWKALAAHSP